MSIRVCSGIYRSRRIECPDKGVRPTTDRVKQAIFSTLPLDITGTQVLDLFAGSGNLGIEALSRGASFVTFVDSSFICTKIIEKNIRSLTDPDHVRIIKSDVGSYIMKCRDLFEFIFMDPPYNKGLASKLAPHVYSLVKTGGVLVIEHSPDEQIPIKPWKIRSYGDTMITYVTKEDE